MRKIELNIISTTEDGKTFDFDIECNDCLAFELLSTLKLFTNRVNDTLIEKIKELNLLEIENEEEREVILREIKASDIDIF